MLAGGADASDQRRWRVIADDQRDASAASAGMLSRRAVFIKILNTNRPLIFNHEVALTTAGKLSMPFNAG